MSGWYPSSARNVWFWRRRPDRQDSYASCPPHIKYVKHLLYVLRGSGVRMKWMGGPNHILQHVPSENPTQNPTTGPPPFGVMV
jgi:hypothetical protein